MDSARSIGEKVRTKLKTPKEGLDKALKRVHETRQLNALVHQDRPPLLGKTSGLLAGVPLTIKDNILQKGAPCTCGSAILDGYIAPYSAHIVDRLIDQGASILGRSNMDEFAMGSTTESSCFGPTLNPWDPSRVPGGSSGGAAASVAAGITPIAIGSSTGGSVRQPAAYCGVVGLKPTYGLLSRRGLVAYASSLDVVAPIGARVEDCALALSALIGKDPLDETQEHGNHLEDLTGLSSRLGVAGRKIGLLVEGLSERNHPDINTSVERCAEILRSQGGLVEYCHLDQLEEALAAYYILAPAEASSNLSRFDGLRYGPCSSTDSLDRLYTQNRSRGFGKEVKRRILMGTFCLSTGYYEAYYGKALGQQAALQSELSSLFSKFDLLLLPTTPDVAPPMGTAQDPMKMVLGDIYTVLANLAGIPAISVPSGLSQGLPIGVQLMAPHGHEESLLSAAEVLETAMGPLECPL